MISLAANKDDLVDMIQHGADKIINSKESMLIQDDIEEIITRGEARTKELSTKYASLNFDDLQIFKSETTTNWEGEDYGGKKKTGLIWIEPSKRERKGQAGEVSYKETANGGMAAVSRATGTTKVQPHRKTQPCVPFLFSFRFSFGSSSSYFFDGFSAEFQFNPPRLMELYKKEDLWYQVRSTYCFATDSIY